MLIARGVDVPDFLNRMTTNDMRGLAKGEDKTTLLLSDKGRILDLFRVFRDGSAYLIACSLCNEDKALAYLEKHVVTDDVEIIRSREKFVSVTVTGENVKEILSECGRLISEGKGGPGGGFIEEPKGYGLLFCKEEVSGSLSVLTGGGRQMTECEYELWRIASGIPTAPGEISEEVNPLECGMIRHISFTKGCYVGQEVIARLDSQGKVPKQMVIIESGSPIASGSRIITTDGKDCGFVSSVAAEGPSTKGLGFIRSAELDFGSEYFAKHDNEKSPIKINKIND